jgi:hypothetical protein
MLYFPELLILAGIFWLASAGEEIRTYSVGHHIGAALAVVMLVGVLLPLGLPLIGARSTLWIVDALILGAATWIVSWPLAKIIYGADNRQATTIASSVAIGYVLINALFRALIRAAMS